MKWLLLILSMFVLPGLGVCQQEHWDTYMARYGTKPGSVLVDMGAMTEAPIKLLPFLIVTGPKAINCISPLGIPDNDDIILLENALASTGNFLSGLTAKKLVGTFTYNCERLNYYYVRDTTGVRNALARMYAISFKDYKYTIKIKADPEWSVYRSFLYPDSSARTWMMANKVLLSMLANGDSLKDERPVKHTLYFTTDSGRVHFASFVKGNSYIVESTRNTTNIALPYEIVVSKKSFVKMDSIIAMEQELKKAAGTYRGYYKGWDAGK